MTARRPSIAGLGVIASRGVITDITALRAAERRLETFLERVPITAYTEGPDADEPFRYIGPRIADLAGYDPADFYADARLFARLVHAEDRAEQLAGYGEPGEPYVARVPCVAPGRRDRLGPRRSGRRARRGTVASSRSTGSCWTQRRSRRRTASAEAERRYRSLVERLPITPYTERGTMDGPFLYIGPQVEAVTGYSAAEFYADEDLFQRLVHPGRSRYGLAGYGDPGSPIRSRIG